MAPLALRSPTVFAVGRERDRSGSTADDVAGWEEHNARSLIALECREPAAEFRGVEANLQLDRLHLALVHADNHHVDRSADLVDSDPTDSLAVYATLGGRSAISWRGGREVIGAGQIMVLDPDRPFSRSFAGGVHELVVKIPRTVVSDVEVTTPVVTDGALGRALVESVSRSIARTPLPSPDEDTIVDFVTAIATGGRGDPTTMWRAEARAFVDRHFADASLSAGDVAAGTGVSERHLSRVFAAAETSVPRYVLARRLDAAFALLSTSPELSTATVAARCGFTSAAHFSRTFARRFGVTAGQVRRPGR